MFPPRTVKSLAKKRDYLPIRIDWVYTDIYHCSTPKAFLFIVMRLSHITYVRDDHRILLDKEKVDKYETLLEKFLRDNGFRIFTETEFTHRAFDENWREEAQKRLMRLIGFTLGIILSFTIFTLTAMIEAHSTYSSSEYQCQSGPGK